ASELPFTPRTAERLMAIARNEVLTDATHESHLPVAVSTLYELSRISKPTLEEKIKDGTITPKLERHEVATKVLERPPPRKRSALDRVQNMRRELEASKAHVTELEAARSLQLELDATRETASGEPT